jgi:hypothetical protein
LNKLSYKKETESDLSLNIFYAFVGITSLVTWFKYSGNGFFSGLIGFIFALTIIFILAKQLYVWEE